MNPRIVTGYQAKPPRIYLLFHPSLHINQDMHLIMTSRSSPNRASVPRIEKIGAVLSVASLEEIVRHRDTDACHPVICA